MRSDRMSGALTDLVGRRPGGGAPHVARPHAGVQALAAAGLPALGLRVRVRRLRCLPRVRRHRHTRDEGRCARDQDQRRAVRLQPAPGRALLLHVRRGRHSGVPQRLLPAAVQRVQQRESGHGQRALHVLPLQGPRLLRHDLHRPRQEVEPTLDPPRVPPPHDLLHLLRELACRVRRRHLRHDHPQRLHPHDHVHVLLRERPHARHLVEEVPDGDADDPVPDDERPGLPHGLAQLRGHAFQDPGDLHDLHPVALLALHELLHPLVLHQAAQVGGCQEDDEEAPVDDDKDSSRRRSEHGEGQRLRARRASKRQTVAVDVAIKHRLGIRLRRVVNVRVLSSVSRC
ncbi:hypothetical protein PybrP1_011357 [[Pythium] brassicae (nom. inval.)]|nr:hypothetical protein PybrP1_011357 [[Pythium] brassicae (nom. inval.)]